MNVNIASISAGRSSGRAASSLGANKDHQESGIEPGPFAQLSVLHREIEIVSGVQQGWESRYVLLGLQRPGQVDTYLYQNLVAVECGILVAEP
jgi:hypothetical protein